jgi:hypothetical protein
MPNDENEPEFVPSGPKEKVNASKEPTLFADNSGENK